MSARTSLSREQVLEAAIELVDERGLDKLTMRSLAQALDVGAMTLYGYVRTKDELLDGIVDLALGRMDLAVDEAAPWDEQLATLFTKLLSGLEERPRVRELLVLRSAEGPSANQVREDVIRILRTAGFSPATAVHSLAMLYAFTLGFAAASHRAGANEHEFTTVDLRATPHLAEAVLAYEERNTDETFALGLRLLLDGIRARKG